MDQQKQLEIVRIQLGFILANSTDTEIVVALTRFLIELLKEIK
jgi:hypothetical protein